MERGMELDRTDIAILRSLQEDARRSLRDVAKRIGVSAPTVASRLATLENLGIVKGYRAILDPELLQESSVHLVVRARLQAVDAVAKALAALDAVRRVTVARGGRIVADATVEGEGEIDRLLETIGANPDVVDFEHHVGVRTVKEEPRAVLADRMVASLRCFQCKRPIEGAPIKLRLGDRDHYVCCESCERLYREKYTKLKANASPLGRGP